MRFHFVTPVWGKWHTSIFLSVNLPSLFSPNNFPGLVQKHECYSEIYTRRSDAKTIRSSAAYKRLSSLMPVMLVELEDRQFSGGPISNQHKLWRMGLKSAKETGAVCVLMIPDNCWSDGSMLELGNVFASGKRLAYMTLLRVTEETFVSELHNMYGSTANGVISLPPSELLRLAMRHIHPIQASLLRGSPHACFHHDQLSWAVPPEGFLVRAPTGHSFAVDPGHYELNDGHHSPMDLKDLDAVFFYTDSDKLLGVSLTPLWKDVDWYYDGRAYDAVEIGKWWLHFDNPIHWTLASQRFCYHAGDMSVDLWRPAERDSDATLRDAYFAREIVRVWRAFKDDLGCRTAAMILAVAEMAGHLHRRWRYRGPFTIFAPTDEALAEMRSGFLKQLLEPGNENQLMQVLGNHVVYGAVRLPVTTIPQRAYELAVGVIEEVPEDYREEIRVTTVNGSELIIENRAGGGPEINGAKILCGKPLLGGNVVYAVDGVLVS